MGYVYCASKTWEYRALIYNPLRQNPPTLCLEGYYNILFLYGSEQNLVSGTYAVAHTFIAWARANKDTLQVYREEATRHGLNPHVGCLTEEQLEHTADEDTEAPPSPTATNEQVSAETSPAPSEPRATTPTYSSEESPTPSQLYTPTPAPSTHFPLIRSKHDYYSPSNFTYLHAFYLLNHLRVGLD
ncbi:hypothetical protein CDD82_1184 [Ophiocordyceps australis]|uniref:Uncharacterized protein n=1 Tax=Ophiocordyceps australis TaxID=1399860 RepID=A0A2C5ZH07_9HYPO|nr:hypothetical protein CDD82_1184 [Ophiocordyceps australis]